MHKFGKVILSRKGFDSTAGGDFSPFDPQTGKYIVLPIPMGKDELAISNPLKYEKIKIMNNYFEGCNASNLKTLMDGMDKVKMERGKYSWPPIIKRNKKPEESEYAHFDPWLVNCPWLEGDSKHQIGAFGQVGGAQTKLAKPFDNQKVCKGSLFLFFSRFKPIKPIGQNRDNTVVPDVISSENLKEEYYIYGWLKVKEVIQQWEQYKNAHDQSLLSRHPHAKKEYFDKYANKKGKNTIYIADEYLFNDGSKFPGCGYFPRLNKYLLLTASDSDQQKCGKKWIPSRWKLRGFFKENCRSVLLDGRKWVPCNDGSDSYLVETTGRWQEAVFDFEESEDFCQWFDRLLE